MKFLIVVTAIGILAAGCSAAPEAKRLAAPTAEAAPVAQMPPKPSNAVSVSVTGEDINQAHNDAYKAFIAAMENRLKKENLRCSGFAVSVSEQQGPNGRKYSVGYSVQTEPAGARPAYRVVDVRSTVWRESGKAMAESKKRHAKIFAAWEPKMRKAYHVVGKETASSGNDSLYHTGTIIYATGPKK